MQFSTKQPFKCCLPLSLSLGGGGGGAMKEEECVWRRDSYRRNSLQQYSNPRSLVYTFRAFCILAVHQALLNVGTTLE